MAIHVSSLAASWTKSTGMTQADLMLAVFEFEGWSVYETCLPEWRTDAAMIVRSISTEKEDILSRSHSIY